MEGGRKRPAENEEQRSRNKWGGGGVGEGAQDITIERGWGGERIRQEREKDQRQTAKQLRQGEKPNEGERNPVVEM